MAETPKVYVICDQNCKFESMTKEQILTAIEQAVSTGEITDIDTGFIQTIKTINGGYLRFFIGTQYEYNTLTEEAKKDLYAIITDDTTREGIERAVAEVLEEITGIKNGSVVVAEANNAENANILLPQLVDNDFIEEKGNNINSWQWNCRYMCNSATIAATLTNLPSGVASPFVLDVKNAPNIIQQELTTCDTGDRKPRRFIRYYFWKNTETVSQWGKWCEILTDNDIGAKFGRRLICEPWLKSITNTTQSLDLTEYMQGKTLEDCFLIIEIAIHEKDSTIAGKYESSVRTNAFKMNSTSSTFTQTLGGIEYRFFVSGNKLSYSTSGNTSYHNFYIDKIYEEI